MHLTAGTGTCMDSCLLAMSMWCLKRNTGPIRKVGVCGCIYHLMIIMGGMVHSSEKITLGIGTWHWQKQYLISGTWHMALALGLGCVELCEWLFYEHEGGSY